MPWIIYNYEYHLRMNTFHKCKWWYNQRKIWAHMYDFYALKGKMMKHSSYHIPSFASFSVPDYILEHHQEITLGVDVFYIKHIPFLHVKSRKIKLLNST